MSIVVALVTVSLVEVPVMFKSGVSIMLLLEFPAIVREEVAAIVVVAQSSILTVGAVRVDSLTSQDVFIKLTLELITPSDTLAGNVVAPDVCTVSLVEVAVVTPYD